jgi:hypothetical protein
MIIHKLLWLFIEPLHHSMELDTRFPDCLRMSTTPGTAPPAKVIQFLALPSPLIDSMRKTSPSRSHCWKAAESRLDEKQNLEDSSDSAIARWYNADAINIITMWLDDWSRTPQVWHSLGGIRHPGRRYSVGTATTRLTSRMDDHGRDQSQGNGEVS